VAKRYHPLQRPCERLLQAESIQNAANIAAPLDPLKLLEEIRAVQAYLAVLAAGENTTPRISVSTGLVSFAGRLSSAWRDGEFRPTFSTDSVPKYLRGLQATPKQHPVSVPAEKWVPVASSATASPKQDGRPTPSYAEEAPKSTRSAWHGQVRAAGLKNFQTSVPCSSSSSYASSPRTIYPKQYKTLARRVSDWRKRARERGVIVGPKTYRLHSDRPHGCRREVFSQHWPEMVECLEQKPNQTALELLTEFQARYPDAYSLQQLSTLARRVRAWRQDAIGRLIGDLSGPVTAARTRVHVSPYAHPNSPE